MISCYVENVIDYIVKLYIGEDHKFLCGLVVNNIPAVTKQEKIKKYLHFRTFFRNESILKEDFEEDQADKMWSILNQNIDLCDKESYWSSELYLYVDPLFREALTDAGTGNYKYCVIKNYFNASSEKNKEINQFINQGLNQ